MAAKDILEKHFNCPICQDQFNNPRRLTCGHVYCHVCVDDLIRRTAGYYRIRRGTVQVFGFKCPECRNKMRIPRPEEPPDKWVFQINRDFKLDGILADLKDNLDENEKEEGKEKKESLPEKINKVEIQTQTSAPAVQANEVEAGEVTAISDEVKPKTTLKQVKGKFLKVIEVNDRIKSQGLCDLVVLVQNGERIIVTPDFEEKQLLAFRLNDENKVERNRALELSCRPWRICKVSETQVAVTGSEPDGVIIFKVKDDDPLTITQDRFISTKKSYYGIAAFPDSFVLTTKDSVDIVRALDGKALNEFKVSTPNVKFPDITYAAITTTNNIVVTDSEAMVSYCVNKEGKILWKKKMNSLGVASDASERIFFVDHEKAVIYLFTNRGRFTSRVVEESEFFKKPSGIAVDNMGRLYVICNNNTITIWELEETED